MRAIVIGSELINLATACNLSEMGYEVTVIETVIQPLSSKESVETQLFRQQLENRARQAGVQFRTGCVVQKFIVQHKHVRGIVICNEMDQAETLMAERFVAALNSQSGALLKSVGIDSPSCFKALNHGQHHNPLVGGTRYFNLFVSVGYSSVGASVVPQSAGFLANAVLHPVVEEDHVSVFQTIQAGFSAFCLSLLGATRSVAA